MNTPIAYPETLRLAYSLRHPEDWSRALEQLAEKDDQATREGLIELLHSPPTARAAVAAVTALEGQESQPLIEALLQALGSPHASVRLAVLRSLRHRKAQKLAPVVSRMLECDPSWMNRQAAVEFLAENPSDRRWDLLKASTDPHWRVRHTLIQVLLQWSNSEAQRQEIANRLRATGSDDRTRGVRRYLWYRQTQGPPDSTHPSEDPTTWCPFWDWDPAVLAWRLEQMSACERSEYLALMPRLIGHEDERVRRWATHALLRDGESDDLWETLAWLDDPRHPAFETVTKLATQFDWERVEQIVQIGMTSQQLSPGQWIWTLDQIETTLAAADLVELDDFCRRAATESPRVRCGLARMVGRTMTKDCQKWIPVLLSDPQGDVVLAMLESLTEGAEFEEENLGLSPKEWQRLLASEDLEIRTAAVRVLLACETPPQFVSELVNDSLCSIRRLVGEWLVKRIQGAEKPRTVGFQTLDSHDAEQWLLQLQQDESPHVRAAAMTPQRAAELLDEPTQETSWLVLERAAQWGKTPLWSLAPKPLKPQPKKPVATPMWLPVQPNTAYANRSLAGFQVSPLGISGHYGLPVEGFQVAMEAGVNFLFWEPNYQTLTEFLGKISPGDRNAVYVVAGTFEASPHRIRKDVERVLAKLPIERIAVFLLFWTRSWNRVTDSVRAMLDQLQKAGMIATYGLSTHNRSLAVEAIESGWNPVMVRHSAAHRGAETTIFPIAQAHRTGLMTFNNTSYGRLLEAFLAGEELSPADCYRYTLGFDAVTACWSAPATIQELHTNLQALHDPDLPPERRRRLQEIGQWVYQEDSMFRQHVRGV